MGFTRLNDCQVAMFSTATNYNTFWQIFDKNVNQINSNKMIAHYKIPLMYQEINFYGLSFKILSLFHTDMRSFKMFVHLNLLIIKRN